MGDEKDQANPSIEGKADSTDGQAPAPRSPRKFPRAQSPLARRSDDILSELSDSFKIRRE